MKLRVCLVALPFALACAGEPSAESARAPEASEAAHAPLPEDVQAVSLLGDTLRAPELPDSVRAVRTAQLEDAMADLEARPEDPDALIWAGRRLAYLGRYREAIDLFSRGIDAHPDDARFYRHRGHRYITTRRFQEAEQDLRLGTERVADSEDEIEPDGQPNALGIPMSSLHFNLWYHLGLAHYLQGELEQAFLAFNEARDVAHHTDGVVAASYWLANIAGRLHLDDRLAALLEDVDADADIIESVSYLNVLLLHAGEVAEEDVFQGDTSTLASTTTAYGVGNWHYMHGRTDRGLTIWERIVEESDQWAAFGFIAAEAELARLREGGSG